MEYRTWDEVPQGVLVRDWTQSLLLIKLDDGVVAYTADQRGRVGWCSDTTPVGGSFQDADL